MSSVHLVVLVMFMFASPGRLVAGEQTWPDYLAAIRASCERSQLAWRTEGESNVRVAWVGSAALPEAKLAVSGTKALELLETWTGLNGVFAPLPPPKVSAKKTRPADPAKTPVADPPPPADQPGPYWIVVLPSKAASQALIDDLRAQKLLGGPTAGRADLARDIASFPLIKVYIVPLEHIAKLPDHFAAYAAGAMAIDDYYRRHGGKNPPIWLREGIVTDLQRASQGDIRATTVAYEMSSRQHQGSWAPGLSRIFAGKEKGTPPMSANDTMRCDLDALPMTSYQQLWSLFCFLRDSAGQAKGPDNKLMQVIERTAAGATGDAAVKEAYGVADPKLSAAWYGWAAKQK